MNAHTRLPAPQSAKDSLHEAGWDGVMLGGNYVSGEAFLLPCQRQHKGTV